MRTGRGDTNQDDSEYKKLRGEPVATIENLLRWERIKLREAAQMAIQVLETGSLPTREYLDYMWTTDVGMKELRTRIEKLRSRIAELEAIKSYAAMTIE